MFKQHVLTPCVLVCAHQWQRATKRSAGAATRALSAGLFCPFQASSGSSQQEASLFICDSFQRKLFWGKKNSFFFVDWPCPPRSILTSHESSRHVALLQFQFFGLSNRFTTHLAVQINLNCANGFSEMETTSVFAL